MLQIKPYTPTQREVPEWHLNDPVPALHGVVRIVIDGHELQMLLQAMRLAYLGPGGQIQFARHDYNDID